MQVFAPVAGGPNGVVAAAPKKIVTKPTQKSGGRLFGKFGFCKLMTYLGIFNSFESNFTLS